MTDSKRIQVHIYVVSSLNTLRSNEEMWTYTIVHGTPADVSDTVTKMLNNGWLLEGAAFAWTTEVCQTMKRFVRA
jgi:hypothetical protein